MADKIAVAVIGAGRLGRFHALKYAQMPDVELRWVVDADASRAQSVAEEASAPYWGTDWRAVLGEVQAASIATPTSTHAQVAVPMLEAGLDLLVEKPLADTPDAAEAIHRAAIAHRRVLMVGHVERFNPAVRALGALRNPRFIESVRVSPFPARSLDVSVVLDLMIHDLDLVLELVGAPVVALEALGTPVLTPHIDIAQARLRFANGVVAQITASRVSRKAERVLRVFAPGMYLSADLRERKLVRVRAEHGALREEVESFPDEDPLFAELSHFVSCVRTRAQPLVDGATGVEAVRIAARVHQCIEGG
ncbi:MAG: gfo/Idh/MocA family oxidoreductase [Zetaproteobacteria bacterium]|nr:MAG: gfo/Idh/MocA family oxidoreductase [Zetaproteobacteria bacterium]